MRENMSTGLNTLTKKLDDVVRLLAKGSTEQEYRAIITYNEEFVGENLFSSEQDLPDSESFDELYDRFFSANGNYEDDLPIDSYDVMRMAYRNTPQIFVEYLPDDRVSEVRKKAEMDRSNFKAKLPDELTESDLYDDERIYSMILKDIVDSDDLGALDREAFLDDIEISYELR